RFVQTASVVFPHPSHHGSQHRLPPSLLMPSAQVASKISSAGCVANELRQADVAAHLVKESVDQTGFLFLPELTAPEIVEIAFFENASGREMAARERVANAEAEEVVLKSGRFADEARIAVCGLLLQMEVHVRVTGPRLSGNVEL